MFHLENGKPWKFAGPSGVLDPGLATILQFLRFCYLCILVTKILRGGPGPEKLGELHSRRTPVNDFSDSLASSEPLFFRFFHLQKITKKTTSQKSTFFSIWGTLWVAPGPIFDDLGVPKGSQGRHFHLLFWMPLLAWILEHFFLNELKNRKMKK